MEFEKVSGEIKIECREITEEMKEYCAESDYWQHGFEYNGEFYYLSNFLKCHDNPWGNMDVPEYIHGYDANNIYDPIFISLISDVSVIVYRKTQQK